MIRWIVYRQIPAWWKDGQLVPARDVRLGHLDAPTKKLATLEALRICGSGIHIQSEISAQIQAEEKPEGIIRTRQAAR